MGDLASLRSQIPHSREGTGVSLARGQGVGSGPRHDSAASGRVEHPCSTAADQGWSALPRDKNQRETGDQIVSWGTCPQHTFRSPLELSPLANMSPCPRAPSRRQPRLPLPNLKRILQPLILSHLRRNPLGEKLPPVRREETVPGEITVYKGNIKSVAERQPFGVDALAARNPNRPRPTVHPVGDHDRLREARGFLRSRKLPRGITRYHDRPAARQRPAEFGIAGRPLDHHPASRLLHEPG